MKVEMKSVFEIKVALVGNVSAGKTTILNALLREQYGEVSMKRTTAGVNFFQIQNGKNKNQSRSATSTTTTVRGGGVENSNKEQSGCGGGADDLIETKTAREDDGTTRSADSVLEEIKADNAVLRESTDGDVACKTFDIELTSDLVDMCPNTILTIVDVPGINEASCNGKYKHWVRSNWETFDCVVVVMDGRQGVNTEEQMSLLNFVNTTMNDIKVLPVIILCSKIDDPEDEEQIELVKEARSEVESIFNVDDRDKSLQYILRQSNLAQAGEDLSGNACTPFPAFLPISGIFAFLFQCCSNIDLDRFRTFDRPLISKLGRDLLGKHTWRKLSEEERIDQVYEALCDPSQYQEGIAETNFDAFLKVLNFAVGGAENQKKIIISQIERTLESAPRSQEIAQFIADMHKKMVRMLTTGQVPIQSRNGDSSTVALLKEAFWRLYDACETKAFQVFNFDSPNQLTARPPSELVQKLATVADELIAYHTFANKLGWDDEKDMIRSRFQKLVRKYIGSLLTFESQEKDCSISWLSLTPIDWIVIFSSINLMCHDKIFCTTFGREKIFMDIVIGKYQPMCFSPNSATFMYGVEAEGAMKCPYCDNTVDFNRFCKSCAIFLCRKVAPNANLTTEPVTSAAPASTNSCASGVSTGPSVQQKRKITKGETGSATGGISTSTGTASGVGSAPASSGGFSFGSAPTGSGGFSFGAVTGFSATTPAPASTSSGGFSFGGAATSAPASTGSTCGSFSFGGAATPAPASTGSGSFSFGAGRATSSGFGATSSTSNTSNSDTRTKESQTSHGKLPSKSTELDGNSKEPVDQCPRHNICGGCSEGAQSRKCTKCFMRFRHIKWNPDKIAVSCGTCNCDLDFNRRCPSCDIFYTLPQGLKSVTVCPMCPDNKLSDGCCSNCSLSYKELPSLESAAKFKYEDDQVVPFDSNAFRVLCRVDPPESLSNPCHFGHLVWKFCGFINSMDPKPDHNV